MKGLRTSTGQDRMYNEEELSDSDWSAAVIIMVHVKVLKYPCKQK